MNDRQYGQGSYGPGHCFHQHITFYLRTVLEGTPPAVAYPQYVLSWEDLWPFILSRAHLFNGAGEHFATFAERSQCFEQFGLDIRRLAFDPDRLIPEIQSASEQRSVILAGVDAYYLPSFTEYMNAHGLSVAALLGVRAAEKQIDLWHWENSAAIPVETLVKSIVSQGSKTWRLHVDPSRRIDPEQVSEAARQAHTRLATAITHTPEEIIQKLEEMLRHDPPLPEDENERTILFYVPNRRLSDGSFRTMWLVRSAAQRLMHARSALEELWQWASDCTPPDLIQRARESFTKWKIVYTLCARWELSATNTLPVSVFQYLTTALDTDRKLGAACLFGNA